IIPFPTEPPCGIFGPTPCAGTTGNVYTFGDPNTNTAFPDDTRFTYSWSITSGNGTVASITSSVTTGSPKTATVSALASGSFTLRVHIASIPPGYPFSKDCDQVFTVNANAATPLVTYTGPGCTETTFKV